MKQKIKAKIRVDGYIEAIVVVKNGEVEEIIEVLDEEFDRMDIQTVRSILSENE